MSAQKESISTSMELKAGEPVWELARMYPPQGSWSEDAYLALDAGRLIEYNDGFLEVLPMPTLAHQRIVLYLLSLFMVYLKTSAVGGEVLVAPLPVKLADRQFREPDIVYLSAERLDRTEGDYPEGGDLVVEVVSGNRADRARDLVEKRHDYAVAGIPEYWIVDPQDEVIIVLSLERDEYTEHGRFSTGDLATSALLPGFSVPVAEVWAAAQLH
jgi:Uma2 family endonuclease